MEWIREKERDQPLGSIVLWDMVLLVVVVIVVVVVVVIVVATISPAASRTSGTVPEYLGTLLEIALSDVVSPARLCRWVPHIPPLEV